jgi:hypothetical protein
VEPRLLGQKVTVRTIKEQLCVEPSLLGQKVGLTRDQVTQILLRIPGAKTRVNARFGKFDGSGGFRSSIA